MYIIYKFIATGGACPTFFTDGTYEQHSLSSRMSAGPGTPPPALAVETAWGALCPG